MSTMIFTGRDNDSGGAFDICKCLVCGTETTTMMGADVSKITCKSVKCKNKGGKE